MFGIKMKYLKDKALWNRNVCMQIMLWFPQYFQQADMILLLIIEWRP